MESLDGRIEDAVLRVEDQAPMREREAYNEGVDGCAAGTWERYRDFQSVLGRMRCCMIFVMFLRHLQIMCA